MVSLLLLILLLVLGFAQLNARVAQYRAAREATSSVQALALAEAGLEDARVKLDRDADFPPRGAVDQLVFSYQEDVFDLDNATRVGSYVVTVDLRWRAPPASIVRITSEGQAGPPGAPTGRRRLTMEVDVAEFRAGAPNPDLFRVLHLEDEGGF
ncbi:MAG: hypothetical protein AB1758_07250 [Candidatus Eremiobacterota bacterium]